MKIPEYDEVECVVPGLEGPCHVCRKRPQTSGYCQMNFGKKRVLVHRWAWERVNGPIPDGLVTDHRCRVRKCFNVKHLRIVTKYVNGTENVVRPIYPPRRVKIRVIRPPKRRRRKTHCVNGHEFTPENTKVQMSNDSWVCRECRRIRKRAEKKRHRARRRAAKEEKLLVPDLTSTV